MPGVVPGRFAMVLGLATVLGAGACLVPVRAGAATCARIDPQRESVFGALVPAGALPEGWAVDDVRVGIREAVVRARSGNRVVEAVLTHPDAGGDVRSRHFAIAIRGPGDTAPEDVRTVGAALVAGIRERDAVDVWTGPSQDVKGPSPPQPGRVAGSTWGLVLGLLAVLGCLLALRLRRVRGGDWLFPRGVPATTPTTVPTRREWAALLALVLAAQAVFFLPALARFLSFHLTNFDIGIYAHGFWHAARGHGFFNSPEGMDHLGSHASPFLYLLLPCYLLVPGTPTLLFLDVAAVTLSAIPAWRIARRRLDAPMALAVTVVFLFQPALTSLSWDIHEVTFALPLMLAALDALDERRAGRFLLFMGLALSCKEDVGLVAMCLGVGLALRRDTRFAGVFVGLLGLTGFVVGVGVIIPMFEGDHLANTMSRYAWMGSGWTALVTAPFLHAGELFRRLLGGETRGYLLWLALPVAFLPVLAPWALWAALPLFLANVLSDHAPMRSGNFHYEALILPGVHAAFVAGQARWIRFVGERVASVRGRQALQYGTLAFALIACVAVRDWKGRSLFGDLDSSDEGVLRRQRIQETLAAVPAGVSVLAPNLIQSHLADRDVSESYYLPEGFDPARLTAELARRNLCAEVVVVPGDLGSATAGPEGPGVRLEGYDRVNANRDYAVFRLR